MAPLSERVNVGVGVVAMRNDEEFVVLHRIGDKHGQFTWSLPGGKPDPGEDPTTAATRELLEETGLCIPPSELQPLQMWTYDRWEDRGIHVVTLYFIGDVKNPHDLANVEPEKHERVQWVTWDALSAFPDPLFTGLDKLALVLG